MIRSKTVLAVAIGILVILSGWGTTAGPAKVGLVISAEKGTVKNGEEIVLTVRFKNLGRRPIIEERDIGSPIQLHYRTTIKLNGYEEVKSKIRPGIGSALERQTDPGEEKRETYRLNDTYDMSRKGAYTIEIQWRDVKSNRISINITE